MEMKQPKKLSKTADDKVIRKPGIGLDIGTAFINCAIMENDEVKIRTQRDAFFDIENEKFSRNMLNTNKANYIESDDGKLLYVVGQEAINFANVFKKEVRRPLHKGVISTREPEALLMIKTIIKSVIGEPAYENEICKFSVPAVPIDADYNIIYHENVLKSFVESFGYKAEPINEGKAICYSELDDEHFTGLSISFGAGMVNSCLTYNGLSSIEFSISRSGDWIDTNAAMSVGERVTKMTTIKEAGIDLLNPKGRHEESISIFYRNFIAYVIKGLEKKLSETSEIPEFPEPISIILAGGTSLAKSFDKVFKQEIEKIKLPFKIKDIRLAEDQMFAVARGALYSALSEYEDE
jgi:actin-like ATPase involved in cell morphogenesis